MRLKTENTGRGYPPAGRLLRSLPNFITSLRFFLACVFCALLHGLFNGGNCLIPAMAVFLAICASDVLDGIAARRLKAESAFGALLDISADFFYVASSLAVLIIMRIIPVWFLVLVTAKFAEYIITSRIISPRIKCKSVEFVRDPLGRYAAVLYFLLPGAICVLYSVNGLDFRFAVNFAIYAALLLTLLSSIARCRQCIKVVSARREVYDER